MRRDKRLDKQYLKLLKEAKKLRVGEQEFIEKEMKRIKK